jgi:F-type H+-transporting ATPase subunit a
VAKPFALAVRLFANMIAGHIVLAVILGFAATSIWVAPASIGGAIFMYMLEIFVGFLQAFVFTFLTAVFLGMAVHPQH